jgi:hypothetical protein
LLPRLLLVLLQLLGSRCSRRSRSRGRLPLLLLRLGGRGHL